MADDFRSCLNPMKTSGVSRAPDGFGGLEDMACLRRSSRGALRRRTIACSLIASFRKGRQESADVEEIETAIAGDIGGWVSGFKCRVPCLRAA